MSKISERKFGFIRDADETDYFFHMDDVTPAGAGARSSWLHKTRDIRGDDCQGCQRWRG